MTTKISTNNLDTSVTTLIAQGGGPKIVSITYPGNDTAADTAGGQTITLTGSGFVAGATVIINGSAVGVVSVASSTTITFVSPALSAGSYVVYVVNADGGTAIAVPGIQYSGSPAWSTAAGSLGSYTETQVVNNTVTATGDAPVTYSVFSGTLPTGATLNANTGVISGTSVLTPNSTTYTFVIRATDAQNQDTDRQFSLTINPDTVTWSSPAANTNYASTVNAAIANVSLSAAAASGQTVTYAANALPTGLSLAAGTISGTPTTAGNVVTLLTATANVTNATATRTISWTISVNNDVNFPYVTTLLSAATPSSTFVADASTNNFNVTVFGDARPTNFGPYTPGYYSAYFDGTGDSLSVAPASAIDLASSDFTIEAWAYPTTQTNAVDSVLGYGTFTIMLYRNSTTWTWEVGNGSSANYFTITGTCTPNTWQHVALTRSGNTFTFWLNGVSAGTGSTANAVSTASKTLNIGYNGVTTQHFTGYISNFRIVKGTAVYTSTFTPSTTPLTAIANTSLLTCQSNRFIDNSTNNFAITRNGDVRVDSFDPFLPDTSFTGRGSGYFDGTGDYLDTPSSSAFVLGSSGNFTIECWIYPNGTQSAYAIIVSTYTDFNSVGGYLNKWNLGFSTTTVLTWYDSTGNAGINSSNFPVNVWSHVAVVRNGATITMYVNGVSVGTQTSSQDYTSQSPVRIGLVPSAATFNGYISNLRIVKGSAVYTANFTPPTAPLTAITNTQLLTLQNNQPNNNSMFLDSSTNNFNITRNGNTTQGTFSPYGGGWSNYFDGNGDYLSLSANSAFDITSGDFTVEMWIYRTTNGVEQYLWSNRADTPARGWEWRINSTNLMQFFFTGGSALTSTGTVPTNTWTHLAVSRQTNTVRFFINGALDSSATFSNGTAVTTSLFLGYGTSGGGYLTGYMSNARLIKGTAIYTSAFTPSTTPLTPIANTSLLTCADNRFIDDSVNNFAITRNGDTSIQRFNPFNPVTTTPTSYSGFFDGTGDFLSTTGSGLGSGNFTIEMWVYMTSYPNAQNAIYSNGNSDNVNASTAVVYINSSGTLAIYNYPTSITTSTTVPLNQWNHIAVVRNSGTIALYINGTSGGSGANSNNISNTTMQIMQGYGGISASPIGYVSNVRVVVGTAVYTTNFTPSTTPLTAIANTALLTCQSATFTDNSINNFAITANGDTAPRQFNPFGWTSTIGGNAAYTPALYGGSAYFDGTGDYLSITQSALAMGTGNFTIECWAYITGSVSNTGIWQLASSLFPSSTSGLSVAAVSSAWQIYYAGTTASGGTAALNTWYHLAIARSGTNLRLYVNGISVISVTDSTNYTGTAISIGGYYTTGFLMTGYISDMRITAGVARYTSNFQPPVAPLAALPNTVLLNNMTGAGIYDSAMMVNYETVGNSGISTSIKKYGSSSLYFDGTGDYLSATTSPNFAFGTGDFTVEAWIYSADVSFSTQRGFIQTSATVGGLQTSYTNGIVIFFGNVTSGSITVNVGGSNYGTGGGAVAVNTWYHVALTRASGVVNLWLNGVSVASGSGNTANLTGQNLVVGGYYSTGYLYNGYLDDVRITRGLARYTSTFTPPSTPFISN